MTRALSVALGLLLGGCMQGNGNDPHAPGDRLGTFHVTALLESSTCGPGALGSTDRWEFDVELSRRDDTLYWLNGDEAIPGTIASDGTSFAFDSETAVAVQPSSSGRAGCTILRTDQASGELFSATSDVPSFKGSLSFGYRAGEHSECDALIGVEGGFAVLPCQMGYNFEAVRTKLPPR